MVSPALSIIIPAHNEEKRIEITLKDYVRYFDKKFKNNYEIIVVLNGCTDNTFSKVKKFLKIRKSVKLLNIEDSVGKGGAVIAGFDAANGKIIGFVDADNSTKAEEFHRLTTFINGTDAVIGSRWIKGAIVTRKQSLKRRIASRGFNIINKILFGIPFRDTQCGAKVFKKDAIKKINGRIKITNWAFDINLLYLLKKLGFKIKEVPTVWDDSDGSNLNVRKQIPRMLLAVIRLRLVYSPFDRFRNLGRWLIKILYRRLKNEDPSA